jgi:hypothetical protein
MSFRAVLASLELQSELFNLREEISPLGSLFFKLIFYAGEMYQGFCQGAIVTHPPVLELLDLTGQNRESCLCICQGVPEASDFFGIAYDRRRLGLFAKRGVRLFQSSNLSVQGVNLAEEFVSMRFGLRMLLFQRLQARGETKSGWSDFFSHLFTICFMSAVDFQECRASLRCSLLSAFLHSENACLRVFLSVVEVHDHTHEDDHHDSGEGEQEQGVRGPLGIPWRYDHGRSLCPGRRLLDARDRRIHDGRWRGRWYDHARRRRPLNESTFGEDYPSSFDRHDRGTLTSSPSKKRGDGRRAAAPRAKRHNVPRAVGLLAGQPQGSGPRVGAQEARRRGDESFASGTNPRKGVLHPRERQSSGRDLGEMWPVGHNPVVSEGVGSVVHRLGGDFLHDGLRQPRLGSHQDSHAYKAGPQGQDQSLHGTFSVSAQRSVKGRLSKGKDVLVIAKTLKKSILGDVFCASWYDTSIYARSRSCAFFTSVSRNAHLFA